MVSLSGVHCLFLGTIIHELGHVLGLEHEHQRVDRDEFVRLHSKAKITKENAEQFDPNPGAQLLTPYDYYSIMHYGPSFWRAIKEGAPDLVEPMLRYGLSALDIDTVNRLYNCTGYDQVNLV